MTMGTRLACMAAGECPSRILPALLFTGNVRGHRRRHGSCASRRRREQASERALADELRMECCMRLGTVVQSPQPLGGVIFTRCHRVDLHLDLALVDRDPQPYGDRVEEQLGSNLTLGARLQ